MKLYLASGAVLLSPDESRIWHDETTKSVSLRANARWLAQRASRAVGSAVEPAEIAIRLAADEGGWIVDAICDC